MITSAARRSFISIYTNIDICDHRDMCKNKKKTRERNLSNYTRIEQKFLQNYKAKCSLKQNIF